MFQRISIFFEKSLLLLSENTRFSASRCVHSVPTKCLINNMQIEILPAFKDNYMYLITDKTSNCAAAIDPAEPECVLRSLSQQGIGLDKILITHHHWDHTAGNKFLRQKFNKEIHIYGADVRIDALTKKIGHRDIIPLGNIVIYCLFTPSHTKGHMCYYVTDGCGSCVFTGDTLFMAGCGKIIEGTPRQMYQSLQVLSCLPDETRIFFGHENSLENLNFANFIECDNPYIVNKMCQVKNLRTKRLPTVPSTIGDEKKINPYLRVKYLHIQERVCAYDIYTTIGNLRKEKEKYKATPS